MDAFAVSVCNGLANRSMKKRKYFVIAAVFGIFQGIMPLIGYYLGSLFLRYIENYLKYASFVILLIIGAKMIVDGIKQVKSYGKTLQNKISKKAAHPSEKEILQTVAEKSSDFAVQAPEGYATENALTVEATPTEDEITVKDAPNEENFAADKTVGEDISEEKELKFGGILVQGIATSIDALAVGVSLLSFSIGIHISAPVIAAITFLICLSGVLLGAKFGKLIKGRQGIASIVGGAVLVLIGINFLMPWS